MKKHLKRIFAAVMAAVTLITAMPSVSALFVTTEWFSYTYEFNGRLGKGFWGQIPKFTTADGKIAYCIQENANTFSAEHNVSELYENLTLTQQNNIRVALIYGYKGNPQYGFSDDVERLATQIMMWLIVYDWYNTGDETAALNIYTENMPSNVASNVKTVYGRMKEGMLEHRTIPSFAVGTPNLINQATYELERDSNGNFTKTLTDERDVLNQFSWTYSGATVTTSGNNMTITSSTPVVSLQLNGEKTTGRYISRVDCVTPVYLTASGNQSKVTINPIGDPVPAYLSVYAAETTGDLEITKVFRHENGVIDSLANYSAARFIISERGTANYITATQVAAGVYQYTGTTSRSGATQLCSLNTASC